MLAAAGISVTGLTVASAVGRLQPIALPAPTGSRSVGVAHVHWIDASRLAPRASDGRRRIELTVFYPAQRGGVPAEYMSPEVARARVAEHGVAQILFSDPGTVHLDARIDAPPVPVSRVIVFLPGAGQSTAEYDGLLEDQASNGIVVIAIDPAGNTPVSNGHGGVVPADSAVYSSPDDSAGLVSWGDRIARDWAADVAFVVERTSAHPNQVPGLSGWRPEAVGVVGHSIGGAAALEACALMSRCAFAADLDGWVFGTVARSGLHRPVLFLWSPVTGCDDACQAAQQRQRAVSKSARPHVIDQTLHGFAHFDFTDHAVEFEPMLHLLGWVRSTNGAAALASVRAELGAFENTYLPREPRDKEGARPVFANTWNNIGGR